MATSDQNLRINGVLLQGLLIHVGRGPWLLVPLLLYTLAFHHVILEEKMGTVSFGYEGTKQSKGFNRDILLTILLMF